MRERLQRSWAERVRRACQWRAGEDPTAVLEALGHVIVWHLVGGLEAIEERERLALGEIAPHALAAARELATRAEDPDEWGDAIALAELGRRLLEGDAVEGDAVEGLAEAPGDLHPPTPRRIASMLDGRLDGLSAAACAVWCLSHDPSEARLLWSMADEPSADADDAEPLLVAAADAEPMRPPDEGKVIGTHEQARAEAVWFPQQGELAVYAEQDVYVSLSGEGLTMRDVRPGYWLGTVDAAAEEVDAELKVGERTWAWRLRIG